MRVLLICSILLHSILSVSGNDRDDEYYQPDSRSDEISAPTSTSQSTTLITVKVNGSHQSFCLGF